MTQEEKDRFFKLQMNARVMASDCIAHVNFLRDIKTIIDSQQVINRTDLVLRIKEHLDRYPSP